MHLSQPGFALATRRYLFEVIFPDQDPSDIREDQLPVFTSNLTVFHSAVARFFAPSDTCGAGGMYRERIRCNPNWRKQYSRYDTVLVNTGGPAEPMGGLSVARVFVLFSFSYASVRHSCALVQWFLYAGRDEDTGYDIVQPE